MERYDTYTDQELAGLIQSGDSSAFKAVYDKYWDKLFFVAAKRLNDEAEAEEVVQDIFLNLWNRRANFKLEKGFDNYLAVAVKFEVFRHRAARLKDEALQRTLSSRYVTDENMGSNLYDLEALKLSLSSTINALPAKCRLVFNMSRDTELTNKQIAEKLGVSEKAVEKHISAALRILRRKFGAHILILMIIHGAL